MGIQFLSTGWLLAAPLFAGGLLLLYFLKLKRREVAVASTFLWQNALNDLRVNAPFQRLRMNLLLILQMLALLLLLLALARPVGEAGLERTDTILLVDVSASMRATDGDGASGGKTRFARAVEEARRVVKDLSFGDRATVVAFSDEARVLTDLTSSKDVLGQALDGLEVTDRPTRLVNALHRVGALIGRGERPTQVYLFSDGRCGPLEGASLPEDVGLQFVRTGLVDENLGIVGMDVHTASGLGEDTTVFGAVQNFSAGEQVLGVDLFVDDALAGSRELTLGPGGVGSVSFPAPLFDEQGPARRVRLQLDPPEGFADAFATDDVAWSLLRPPAPKRVLLVTGGNVFLHSALSEDPSVAKTPRGDVPLMAPEEWNPDDPALAEFDVIVLDRFTPDVLPPGNYICFGARPPFPGFQDLGQAEDTEVLDWDETHPVARFVNFATLILPTARRLEPLEGDKIIARATHGPLVIESRHQGRRAVVCAFDLMSLPVEGAWTFDPSYPIFLANAVRHLAGGGADASATVRTAGTAQLRFPNGTVRAKVTPPDGRPPLTLKVVEGDDVLRVSGLERVGIYGVAFEDEAGKALGEAAFAVNLADAEESVIAPTETVEVAGRTKAVAQDEAEQENRDLWKYAIAACLAFVMVEWWIYNRRVFL